MNDHDLFFAWLILGGLEISFGQFAKLYHEEGDAGPRRYIGYKEFDPEI